MDDSDSPETPAYAPTPGTLTRAVALPPRPDAFTPEQMARFCEVLAETGIVTIACKAVGTSRDTAYAHRRRNPLFASAWAAALSHARNRLADALLERSIEGSVDYLYRDGELVGERRYIDNRLAYAMLRRLDKQAEATPPAIPARPGAPADWSVAIRALRTGSEEDLSAALAMMSDLPDTPDNPPNPKNDGDEEDYDDEDESLFTDQPFGTSRIWQDEGDWRTNYPPPSGFTGEECGRWYERDYERACTPGEVALLTAAHNQLLAEDRAEEERERDQFFASLKTGTG